MKIPSKPYLYIAVVLSAIPVGLSAHQSSFEELLKECASFDDDGQRHSCYDRVLRPDKTSAQSVAPATTEHGDKPEAVKPAQVQTELVKDKPVAAEDQPVAAEDQPVAVEDQPVAVEDFGLKEKQPRETVHITVTVNGIRKNLANRFVYTTTDGQVWVQIDTRRPRYDEVPFIAEIRTASLGSFYLKPQSYGFSVRVRREK